MLGLLAFVLHIFAIYIGAKFAELEYVDIWRCLTVALVGIVAQLLVGLLLSPILIVPVLRLAFGTLVLLIGTGIAAKAVLSCDWRPAWTIAIVASIINALFNWLFT